MVRKRVLVPLLAAANLLVAVGFAFLVVPLVFEIPCPPCPAPSPGPEGRASSPAPSPGPAAGGGEEALITTCLRVPRAVLFGTSFFVGILMGCACIHCYNRFADDEEDEAAGAAKRAGYVAIADDSEAGTGAGGKN